MIEHDLFRYPNYDDLARLRYGRMLWHNEAFRERLLRHWLDPRHPYRERFIAQREQIERVLANRTATLEELDHSLRLEGTSLRALMREIPPVFGSFF